MIRKIIFVLLYLFLISCSRQSPRTDSQKAEPGLTPDKYFQEIYKKKRLIKADDQLMMSILDSLSSTSAKQSFYFVVFTKSMNGADGFISEGIGQSAFNFITTKTDKFAGYFNSLPELGTVDLNNWADHILGEIQVSNENRVEKAVSELESLLTKNVNQSGEERKLIIEKLNRRIRTKAKSL